MMAEPAELAVQEAPDPTDWPAVARWRRDQRARLIGERLRVLRTEREAVRSSILRHLEAGFPDMRPGRVGFYWPFKGEIDVRGFVRALIERGWRAALPVVATKNAPLEFAAWRPRTPMARGIWNIPVPAERIPVAPDVLLIPLVGFDRAGYRLGHGGGYYDRTLAIMNPRPITIGIGFALGQLSTIHPQPHDIRMNAIVTEEGLHWVNSQGRAATAVRPGAGAPATAHASSQAGYASPPCLMHEVDPAYFGYLSAGETVEQLNRLLSEARTAALVARRLSDRLTKPTARRTLIDIATNEARWCGALHREIEKLHGTATREMGDPASAALAETDPQQSLLALTRRHDRLVQQLRETLPRVAADDLHSNLDAMLGDHERNLGRCAALARTATSL
jgi:5-formyltetrahydrofolate cyclo-ligase